MLSIALVAYLTLFILVGVLTLFVALLLGRFLRPHAPSVQKQETYECGEPAVGSSYVQFDLRFYVVALLFIVFEVELAFFFPPAVVFGKINQMLGPNFGPKVHTEVTSSESMNPQHQFPLTDAAKSKFTELGISSAKGIARKDASTSPEESLNASLRSLSLMALLDLAVFFLVLLVGFAYLWKRGDLDWVRAIARQPEGKTPPGKIKLAVVGRQGESE